MLSELSLVLRIATGNGPQQVRHFRVTGQARRYLLRAASGKQGRNRRLLARIDARAPLNEQRNRFGCSPARGQQRAQVRGGLRVPWIKRQRAAKTLLGFCRTIYNELRGSPVVPSLAGFAAAEGAPK